VKDYKTAVVIGRFQPFHSDHKKVVDYGLEIAERVVVVVGSINAAPSTKNPWSFQDRIAMIQKCYPGENQRRLAITGVRDHFYNDQAWLADVQAKTDMYIEPGETVALLGSYKDRSSYYLNSFPQWEFQPVHTGNLNSTDLRNSLLQWNVTADWEGKPSNIPELHELNDLLAGRVPEAVKNFIRWWTTTSKDYPVLAKEWKFQKSYRESWATAPFPPTFVTADAVVVCSGHVLVIERKINPGKGLFAVPGGFVRQDEFIEDAAIRELREETGIRINPVILQGHIENRMVFDYPTRSERGRTITHGFYIKLPDGKLPEVKGGDDAKRAFWMPLFEAFANERKFFEDHLHIIMRFVGAQGER
jgi:bifunctional NMN adenylyltransferase/nudix hydrolase